MSCVPQDGGPYSGWVLIESNYKGWDIYYADVPGAYFLWSPVTCELFYNGNVTLDGVKLLADANPAPTVPIATASVGKIAILVGGFLVLYYVMK